MNSLHNVLTRLEQAGKHLKKENVHFYFLRWNTWNTKSPRADLHPTKEKVRAIVEAPAQQNVSQLKSFLGMLNYYCKFLPNLSTVLAPLYSLLHKNRTWQWKPAQESAFTEAKRLLTSSQVLVHYDSCKPLVLSCDASPYVTGSAKTRHNHQFPVYQIFIIYIAKCIL